jgi:hypothetical protein
MRILRRIKVKQVRYGGFGPTQNLGAYYPSPFFPLSRKKNSENGHTGPMEGLGADGGGISIDHRYGAIYTDSVSNISVSGIQKKQE